MEWSCDECGTVMKLWQMKCPNCKQSGMSALHGAAILAVLVVAVLVAIKIFT